jgi:hypothetical protein
VHATEFVVPDGVIDTATGGVTVHGRGHYLEGVLDGPVPPAAFLWVVTNPRPDAYYLQGDGPVVVQDDLRFVAPFNIGLENENVDRPPNEVRLVQVAKATSEYFASCGPAVQDNPQLDAPLPWHVVASVAVSKAAE